MIIHNYPQHEHLCPQATLVRNGEAVKIIEQHKPNRPVSLQNCQWLCVLGFRLIMNHLLANICRSSSNLQTAVRHRNVPYPHFQDEKERIERLGGSVVHWGTWRVNGQLAVSRAIGEWDVTSGHIMPSKRCQYFSFDWLQQVESSGFGLQMYTRSELTPLRWHNLSACTNM